MGGVPSGWGSCGLRSLLMEVLWVEVPVGGGLSTSGHVPGINHQVCLMKTMLFSIYNSNFFNIFFLQRFPPSSKRVYN